MSPAQSRPPAELVEDRLDFETLITDISARLLAAPADAIEQAIRAALEDVRVFFRADRCGLLKDSDDQQGVNVLSATYSEGVAVVSGDIPLDQLFPWSRQKLVNEGVPVNNPRMGDLPPEAAGDRASFAQMAALSSLAVPIRGSTF